MANVLNEEKKQQVLALGRLGWSLRRIQQATGIRRETAGVYLRAAGIAVRPPSGWGRCASKPANEVITDSVVVKPVIPVVPDPLDPNCNPNPENFSTKGKAKPTSKPANENEVITDSAVVPSPSTCEPYREAIDLGISRGRNAMAIWQDLVSEYGFASSYQSVQRFVRKRRGTQTPEARVVIVTAAGQEAQVDYGTGPMVRDPESRKYRRTRLFVMTLGCSRKSVRLLTFRSSSRIWAELHERAFRRLGGPPASSCSTICAKACSSPMFTIPRSILFIATCSRTTARSLCLAAYKIPTAKAKLNRASVMRRKHR